MIAILVIALVGAASGPTAVPSASQAPARDEWGVAPDGARGFGAGRKLRDISRLLRSKDTEDRELVSSLYALGENLHVLLSLVANRYGDLGYFRLIDLQREALAGMTRQDWEIATPLERLGALFRERSARSLSILETRGEEAALLPKLLVDARFRARIDVIDGLEFEIADLLAGLAVLHAELDGHATLRDHEAEAIARRVDLSASRLRAARLDLEALREGIGDTTAATAWAQDLEQLLALVETADPERRARELPRLLARLDQRESAMASVLFSSRTSDEVRQALAQRAAALATAADLLLKVRTYLPKTSEGKHAPPDVAALSNSRRYAYAARLAAEGLGHDPLQEELNFLAGEANDLLWGNAESRRYYDRFLALRGIRVHDHRTWQDRELTPEERRAIEVVQAVATGGPTSSPPPPPPPDTPPQ